MRRLPLLAAVVALGAAAAPAAAQHCWPTALSLVVRGADGAVLPPAEVDSIAYWPVPQGVAARAAMRLRRASPELHGGLAGADSAVVHYWPSIGGCRLQVDSVRIVEGGRTMTLLVGLRVDTEETPGHSIFAIETPPVGDGRWRLPRAAIDATRGGDPRILRAAAWIREETPPRAP